MSRSSASLESSRRASREAKRLRGGVCEVCGGPTRYAGKKASAVSPVCADCAPAHYGPKQRGRGPVIEAVLAFCSEPRRYMEIARHVGVSRDQMGPTLARALQWGQLERVSRGVYRTVGPRP